MKKNYIHKYGIVLLLIILLVPYKCYSNDINNLFYKIGYSKKLKYDISVMYNHYNQNNNFQTHSLSLNNSLLQNNIYGNTEAIVKMKDGIKAEIGAYIIPPIRVFVNYSYGISDTYIKYKINKVDFKYLIKDYVKSIKITDEEHTFLAGFDFIYEYKYKKFIPYILLTSAFGVTTSSNYENIYYSLNFALKTGLVYEFNKNIKLNTYLGADYTSYYNGNYILDTFNIHIPQQYMHQNMNMDFNAKLFYEEIYNKNISMITGIELELYKHSALFAELKYINNFNACLGVKVKF